MTVAKSLRVPIAGSSGVHEKWLDFAIRPLTMLVRRRHGKRIHENLETMTPAKSLFVTLPLDPHRGWQFCRMITGYYAQTPVTGPHTWAVETTYADEVLLQHGAWDRADAQQYARDLGNGDRSRAIEVEPYWYCVAWGVVPAASVHELDVANMNDWSIRPAAAIVLGTGEGLLV